MIALQSFYNPEIINMKLLGQLLIITQTSLVQFISAQHMLIEYCVPGTVLGTGRYRKIRHGSYFWGAFTLVEEIVT